MLMPWRMTSRIPVNPNVPHGSFGRSVALVWKCSSGEIAHAYGKPAFDLNETPLDTGRVSVHGKLSGRDRSAIYYVHFETKLCPPMHKPDPRSLIVAQMSGHYATLLRRPLFETRCPRPNLTSTDWKPTPGTVPVSEGRFAL